MFFFCVVSLCFCVVFLVVVLCSLVFFCVSCCFGVVFLGLFLCFFRFWCFEGAVVFFLGVVLRSLGLFLFCLFFVCFFLGVCCFRGVSFVLVSFFGAAVWFFLGLYCVRWVFCFVLFLLFGVFVAVLGLCYLFVFL